MTKIETDIKTDIKTDIRNTTPNACPHRLASINMNMTHHPSCFQIKFQPSSRLPPRTNPAHHAPVLPYLIPAGDADWHVLTWVSPSISDTQSANRERMPTHLIRNTCHWSHPNPPTQPDKPSTLGPPIPRPPPSRPTPSQCLSSVRPYAAECNCRPAALQLRLAPPSRPPYCAPPDRVPPLLGTDILDADADKSECFSPQSPRRENAQRRTRDTRAFPSNPRCLSSSSGCILQAAYLHLRHAAAPETHKRAINPLFGPALRAIPRSPLSANAERVAFRVAKTDSE